MTDCNILVAVSGRDFILVLLGFVNLEEEDTRGAWLSLVVYTACRGAHRNATRPAVAHISMLHGLLWRQRMRRPGGRVQSWPVGHVATSRTWLPSLRFVPVGALEVATLFVA